MDTVNEVVRRKLGAYPKAEAHLALKAVELAEKLRNETSVAERLTIVVRKLAQEEK